MSINALADLTSMDRRVVSRRLVDLPCEDRGHAGKFYESSEALPKIYDTGTGGKLDPQQEKAKLDCARRELAELEIKAKQRELIPISECNTIIDIAAVSCREHLQTIPGRYASIFAAQEDARQIEQDLDAEIRTALEHIANASSQFL